MKEGPMTANDLDDDILEELKSIANLLERVAQSQERTENILAQAWTAYMQIGKR
jgi:predicted YcjX-like family ATPase